MVDIKLQDEISIVCLFSTCSWFVAGLGILSLPLSQVKNCSTLPVALQYLKYQIMLTIITNTIVPSIVIINNQLGVTNG